MLDRRLHMKSLLGQVKETRLALQKSLDLASACIDREGYLQARLYLADHVAPDWLLEARLFLEACESLLGLSQGLDRKLAENETAPPMLEPKKPRKKGKKCRKNSKN